MRSIVRTRADTVRAPRPCRSRIRRSWSDTPRDAPGSGCRRIPQGSATESGSAKVREAWRVPRIVAGWAGSLQLRRAAGRHAPDERPDRGRRCSPCSRRGTRSRAPPCWTSTPARARSGWRRSAAAPPPRCSSRRRRARQGHPRQHRPAAQGGARPARGPEVAQQSVSELPRGAAGPGVGARVPRSRPTTCRMRGGAADLGAARPLLTPEARWCCSSGPPARPSPVLPAGARAGSHPHVRRHRRAPPHPGVSADLPRSGRTRRCRPRSAAARSGGGEGVPAGRVDRGRRR